MYEDIQTINFNILFSQEDDQERIATVSDATSTDSMILYDINNNLEKINYNVGTLMLVSLVIVILKFHNIMKAAFRNNSKEI